MFPIILLFIIVYEIKYNKTLCFLRAWKLGGKDKHIKNVGL